MTVACSRCGFPNDEKAMHCRACSAPLQDASNEAAIKPRLRQIIAETRARTRARQRRGISVDPNRVDVVPRLPSGVAASDAALKTALEKGRQARLQGLREELRKGRPDFAPPAQQSLPSKNLTIPPIGESTVPPTQTKETPPAAETTAAPTQTEEPPTVLPNSKDQIAEEFLNQPPKNPTKIISAKAVKAEPKPAEKPELAAAKKPDPIEVLAPPEPAPPALEIQTVEAPITQSEPPQELIARNHDERQQTSDTVEPTPKAAHLERLQTTNHEIERTLEPHPEPSLDPSRSTPGSTQAAPEEIVDHSEPLLKPVLSAAAKTAIYRLRETAKRLKSIAPSSQALEIENACQLYGKQRLIATSIDSLPVLTYAILWLSTQFRSGQRPPEEIIASWLLGESGGVPWGLLLIGVFWLLWCWAGIIAWSVTPGMKAAKLSWHTPNRWKRFARPPLFLISLIPLGLGGTYALLDKNSRGLSDVLLRLTWYRN